MESETKNSTEPLRPIMLLLATIMALYTALWILYLFQSRATGNFGGVLVCLMFVAILIYILATPVVCLVFLSEIWMPNFRDGELSKVEPKVFRQFVISMAGWIVMLMACYFVFISTLGGEDLPFYLQNTRIVEGPDTNYARAGFEQLLDRPVPSHVSQIYFRDQSSIGDEHQTLHFTTTEPSFIQDLVQEYKLEQRHGGFTEGEGDYGDHYRTLFYNRDTGEVKYISR